jgi:hypothetical protein
MITAITHNVQVIHDNRSRSSGGKRIEGCQSRKVRLQDARGLELRPLQARLGMQDKRLDDSRQACLQLDFGPHYTYQHLWIPKSRGLIIFNQLVANNKCQRSKPDTCGP